MNSRARNRWRKIVIYLVISVIAAALIYPLLWMVSSSFKPEAMIFQNMGLVPRAVTLENYGEGWKGVSGITFTRFFMNSFIIVGLIVIGTLASSSITAYAFARLKFPFRSVMFVLMMMTIMVPFHAVLIPQYTMFLALGWVNTILPLVVPRFFATNAFFVFLMVQFIRNIPRELDEASIIDGCNQFSTFSRIILPLTTPALITTFIFSFIWSYNDFFAQMIYLSEPKALTISVALRFFLDATARSHYGQLFAMSTASLVPIFILFILFQRYIIEGISTSGMKG